MRKIILSVTVGVFLSLACNGQSAEEKTPRFNKYIGAQMNLLLKEVLNFSENDSANANPYLLTYGMYSAKKGWGMDAGIGFDIKNVTDKNFPGEVGSKYYDFYFRAGPGRIMKLGNKFEAGFNVNLLYNLHGSTSFSSMKTDFGLFTDSTATHVEHNITGLGIGGLLNLSFHFTDHVMIGTELVVNAIHTKDKKTTTFYVMHSNNVVPGNTQTTEVTTEEADTDTYKIYAPVAIYLIAKF